MPPQLLVGVIEEVVDSTGASVARRFGYAYVGEDGSVAEVGAAPYLDCIAAPDVAATQQAKALPWLHEAEKRVVSWIIENELPNYLAEVQSRRTSELEKQRGLVEARLKHERDRLITEAMAAADKERLGEKPRESSGSLSNKAADLQVRLDRRVELIDRQAKMLTKPPLVVAAALVLPVRMLDAELPCDAPIRAKETKGEDRRGVDLVLSQERALGRIPVEQAISNPGYHILSSDPTTGDSYRIAVKTRLAGATDFWVTHNEVLTGKNAAPRFRLVLVRVDPDGPEKDEVRYLDDPFANVELGDSGPAGHKGDWIRNWDRGRAPF